MSTKTTLAVISLIIAPAGCASNANAREDSPGNPTPLEIIDTSSVEVVLARTPCFGSCPSYRVAIKGDGTVNFTGNQHVDSLDPAAVTLSRSDVAHLLRAFEAFDYRALRNYDSSRCYDISDNPSAYTSITYDGVTHAVDHYYGCSRAPTALLDLEGIIDSIAGVSRWIGQGTNSRTAEGGVFKERMASVVFVRHRWELRDDATNHALHFRFIANRKSNGVPIISGAGDSIATFERTDSGRIIPSLTTDQAAGPAVGSVTSGNGVVVTQNGWILTDAAVVATARLPYDFASAGIMSGVLVGADGPVLSTSGQPIVVDAPTDWIAAEATSQPAHATTLTIDVDLGDGRPVLAEFARRDAAGNVALIRINHAASFPDLPRRATAIAKDGSLMMLYRDHAGADVTLAVGVVVNASAGYYEWSSSAPRTSSVKGSPVFDTDGALAGMYTARSMREGSGGVASVRGFLEFLADLDRESR